MPVTPQQQKEIDQILGLDQEEEAPVQPEPASGLTEAEQNEIDQILGIAPQEPPEDRPVHPGWLPIEDDKGVLLPDQEPIYDLPIEHGTTDLSGQEPIYDLPVSGLSPGRHRLQPMTPPPMGQPTSTVQTGGPGVMPGTVSDDELLASQVDELSESLALGYTPAYEAPIDPSAEEIPWTEPPEEMDYGPNATYFEELGGHLPTPPEELSKDSFRSHLLYGLEVGRNMGTAADTQKFLAKVIAHSIYAESKDMASRPYSQEAIAAAAGGLLRFSEDLEPGLEGPQRHPEEQIVERIGVTETEYHPKDSYLGRAGRQPEIRAKRSGKAVAPPAERFTEERPSSHFARYADEQLELHRPPEEYAALVMDTELEGVHPMLRSMIEDQVLESFEVDAEPTAMSAFVETEAINDPLLRAAGDVLSIVTAVPAMIIGGVRAPFITPTVMERLPDGTVIGSEPHNDAFRLQRNDENAIVARRYFNGKNIEAGSPRWKDQEKFLREDFDYAFLERQVFGSFAKISIRNNLDKTPSDVAHMLGDDVLVPWQEGLRKHIDSKVGEDPRGVFHIGAEPGVSPGGLTQEEADTIYERNKHSLVSWDLIGDTEDSRWLKDYEFEVSPPEGGWAWDAAREEKRARYEREGYTEDVSYDWYNRPTTGASSRNIPEPTQEELFAVEAERFEARAKAGEFGPVYQKQPRVASASMAGNFALNDPGYRSSMAEYLSLMSRGLLIEMPLDIIASVWPILPDAAKELLEPTDIPLAPGRYFGLDQEDMQKRSDYLYEKHPGLVAFLLTIPLGIGSKIVRSTAPAAAQIAARTGSYGKFVTSEVRKAMTDSMLSLGEGNVMKAAVRMEEAFIALKAEAASITTRAHIEPIGPPVVKLIKADDLIAQGLERGPDGRLLKEGTTLIERRLADGRVVYDKAIPDLTDPVRTFESRPFISGRSPEVTFHAANARALELRRQAAEKRKINEPEAAASLESQATLWDELRYSLEELVNQEAESAARKASDATFGRAREAQTHEFSRVASEISWGIRRRPKKDEAWNRANWKGSRSSGGMKFMRLLKKYAVEGRGVKRPLTRQTTPKSGSSAKPRTEGDWVTYKKSKEVTKEFLEEQFIKDGVEDPNVYRHNNPDASPKHIGRCVASAKDLRISGARRRFEHVAQQLANEAGLTLDQFIAETNNLGIAEELAFRGYNEAAGYGSLGLTDQQIARFVSMANRNNNPRPAAAAKPKPMIDPYALSFVENVYQVPEAGWTPWSVVSRALFGEKAVGKFEARGHGKTPRENIQLELEGLAEWLRAPFAIFNIPKWYRDGIAYTIHKRYDDPARAASALNAMRKGEGLFRGSLLDNMINPGDRMGDEILWLHRQYRGTADAGIVPANRTLRVLEKDKPRMATEAHVIRLAEELEMPGLVDMYRNDLVGSDYMILERIELDQMLRSVHTQNLGFKVVDRATGKEYNLGETIGVQVKKRGEWIWAEQLDILPAELNRFSDVTQVRYQSRVPWEKLDGFEKAALMMGNDLVRPAVDTIMDAAVQILYGADTLKLTVKPLKPKGYSVRTLTAFGEDPVGTVIRTFKTQKEAQAYTKKMNDAHHAKTGTAENIVTSIQVEESLGYSTVTKDRLLELPYHEIGTRVTSYLSTFFSEQGVAAKILDIIFKADEMVGTPLEKAAQFHREMGLEARNLLQITNGGKKILKEHGDDPIAALNAVLKMTTKEAEAAGLLGVKSNRFFRTGLWKNTLNAVEQAERGLLSYRETAAKTITGIHGAKAQVTFINQLMERGEIVTEHQLNNIPGLKAIRHQYVRATKQKLVKGAEEALDFSSALEGFYIRKPVYDALMEMKHWQKVSQGLAQRYQTLWKIGAVVNPITGTILRNIWSMMLFQSIVPDEIFSGKYAKRAYSSLKDYSNGLKPKDPVIKQLLERGLFSADFKAEFKLSEPIHQWQLELTPALGEAKAILNRIRQGETPTAKMAEDMVNVFMGKDAVFEGFADKFNLATSREMPSGRMPSWGQFQKSKTTPRSLDQIGDAVTRSLKWGRDKYGGIDDLGRFAYTLELVYDYGFSMEKAIIQATKTMWDYPNTSSLVNMQRYAPWAFGREFVGFEVNGLRTFGELITNQSPRAAMIGHMGMSHNNAIRDMLKLPGDHLQLYRAGTSNLGSMYASPEIGTKATTRSRQRSLEGKLETGKLTPRRQLAITTGPAMLGGRGLQVVTDDLSRAFNDWVVSGKRISEVFSVGVRGVMGDGGVVGALVQAATRRPSTDPDTFYNMVDFQGLGNIETIGAMIEGGIDFASDYMPWHALFKGLFQAGSLITGEPVLGQEKSAEEFASNMTGLHYEFSNPVAVAKAFTPKARTKLAGRNNLLRDLGSKREGIEDATVYELVAINAEIRELSLKVAAIGESNDSYNDTVDEALKLHMQRSASAMAALMRTGELPMERAGTTPEKETQRALPRAMRSPGQLPIE